MDFAMKIVSLNLKETLLVNLLQWILELTMKLKVQLKPLSLDNSMIKVNFMALVELHALVPRMISTKKVNSSTTNSMALEEN